MNDKERNNLQEIITQSLEVIKEKMGAGYAPEKVNLAEMERLTGLSRSKLRTLKENGFVVKPHGNSGRKREVTVLTGFTGVIDDLLSKSVTNSEVIYERIVENGYKGGLTQVKEYISKHRDLIPAKRQIVSPQGNRGRRYSSGPGEAYQMDWGFVNVDTDIDHSYRVACFAMICHHCGERYVEFFPNAMQENLFIGMIHAFQHMGVPDHVLTDNMKSVINGRDSEGHPLWNKEYEQFMDTIGFRTRLCKPRHPFTKGSVERLIKFVKGNFIAGRVFTTITELNIQAQRWCNTQNGRYHQCVDCIPHYEHNKSCMERTKEIEGSNEVALYLHPSRKISFDGFINYEGRRFGVPYWYQAKTCRVIRESFTLYIYSMDLSKKLAEHNVTWNRKASFCKDQYASEQPEELPSMPVTVSLQERIPPEENDAFSRFSFEREVIWDE